MLGFVNGLAIVMTQAQCRHFFDPVTGGLLRGARGAAMAGLSALTMLLVKLLPKVTSAVPPSLGAVAIVTVLARVFALPATTLVDLAGKEAFAGGLSVLPSVGIPALAQVTAAPLKALAIALPYGITMAAVGMVESLLTLQLVDGLVDDGTRGSTRKECVGLGLGNIASGLTGGMGGCALIGQSLINVESGGTSRLSGMAMAAFLGVGLIFASPLLAMVPISALVGVMLLVCHSTFAWSSLRLFGKVPKTDMLIILLVSFVTVYEDLAKAVIAGTILSALSFSWKQSTNIRVRSSAAPEAGWSAYSVDGPLFFGSTGRFLEQFSPKTDPDDVVIDFMDSRVADHSGLVAINTLADKYGDLGKRVHLLHLSSDCAALLERLNGELPPYEIIELDPGVDPIYEVAEEPEVYADVPAPTVGDSDDDAELAWATTNRALELARLSQDQSRGP
jgi:SulP family sulfate permease